MIVACCINDFGRFSDFQVSVYWLKKVSSWLMNYFKEIIINVVNLIQRYRNHSDTIILFFELNR